MITEGIINVNKPQNMTSHDVVAIVRRLTGLKRVGHTGTLDPMATGVLPVCLGSSARIMEYLDLDIKEYRCKLLLGVETDTQDIWGNVISRNSTENITENDITNAFSQFKGVIDQKPPMYSAIRVNGKRLYEYAREGIEVEVKTRKIYIKSLDIIDMDLSGTEKTVTFTVECSKGTYIRTICQDAGMTLGCGGTLTELTRTGSGIFTIGEAVELEQLKLMNEEQIQKLIYNTSDPLVNFGRIMLDEKNGLMFANGWRIPLSRCEIIKKPLYESEDYPLPIRDEYRRAYNMFSVINGSTQFLGVAFYDGKEQSFKADKVFYKGKE